jgi:hypothetical protein
VAISILFQIGQLLLNFEKSPRSPLMTRFIRGRFAKDYLEEVLSPGLNPDALKPLARG